MDVKISYRVPFEEIPSRLQNMLIESRNKLEESAERVNQQQINNNNIISVLKNIEDIRKMLLRVDNQLSDCYNILAGYNKALAESAIQQTQEDQDAVNVDNNPA